jgi:hypothetical protein
MDAAKLERQRLAELKNGCARAHAPSLCSAEQMAPARAYIFAASLHALVPRTEPSRWRECSGPRRGGGAAFVSAARASPCVDVACRALARSRAAMIGVISVLIANSIPGAIPLPINFPAGGLVLPF